MDKIYIVYHQSADSYFSVPEFPKAAFSEKADAEEFAKQQYGYGFNIDWFVKEIPFNPTEESNGQTD